jgi:hypothetical protein
MSDLKHHSSIHIKLAGNFAPEWRQLVDAIRGDGVNDANIADSAREFVDCVMHLSQDTGIHVGDQIRHAYWNGETTVVHDTPALTVTRVDRDGKIHTEGGGVFSGACCVKV